MPNTNTVFPNNQIAKIQTSTKLISLHDKLQPANPLCYAQLHAKGEDRDGSVKRNSLIHVIMLDYTNGTGANTVRVSYNLSPEQIQFFLSRVACGVQTFEWQGNKIFGNPDAQGLCIAQIFSISRTPVAANGEANRAPWKIQITNGRGEKVTNKVGGSYMKGGSFRKESYVAISVTDMDLFTLLTRANAFIRAFELSQCSRQIMQGRESYERFTAENRVRGTQAAGYQQAGLSPAYPQNIPAYQQAVPAAQGNPYPSYTQAPMQPQGMTGNPNGYAYAPVNFDYTHM